MSPQQRRKYITQVSVDLNQARKAKTQALLTGNNSLLARATEAIETYRKTLSALHAPAYLEREKRL